MIKKLVKIQNELKAPKNQRNGFGKYNYRSCEDILEAVKPLANSEDCVVTVSDEVIQVGNRIYVKATARLISENDSVQTTAYAREPEQQKGMNEAQITGSASSYARKYALNGLFAIDDTKDADATNEHGNSTPKKVALSKKVSKPTGKEVLTQAGFDFLKDKGTLEQVTKALAEREVTDLQKSALLIIKGQLTK
tara:strand:+ start:681 stop:1262 length:582 start_codon:yes stop_codon:yes gene_type:complete